MRTHNIGCIYTTHARSSGKDTKKDLSILLQNPGAVGTH